MEFQRKQYLQQLIEGQQSNMVKIVTGIRRCGKSYLLFNIFKKHLLASGTDEKHIIGLSMEDMRNEHLVEPRALLEYIDSKNPNDGHTTYVIIDEVQMVDNFVGVLLSLMHTPDMQVYVSGSNSKFLSSDVVTEFRGRGWEIRVHPLSFAEYYEEIGGNYQEALTMYYRYGGLPYVATLPTEKAKKQYLRSVFETTYLKDVIDRNHLRNPDGMRHLIQVLASDIGACTNPTKIANTFQTNEKISISANTISDYLQYLQDAFIINEAQRYDVKGRKYIGTASKYYFEDLGIRNMLLNFRQQEENHIMENVMYNELCLRGYNVDVGQVEVWEKDTKGKYVRKNLEVDFVANNPPQRMYIQSAYDLPTREKTLQEQRPLVNISDHFKKVLVLEKSSQPEWIDEEGVQIIGLKDFLLNFNILD